MPIAINGSGTLTGISVGGLPDGIVDTDMLAANAVTAAKASGSAKGITMVDQWRITDHFNLTTSAVVVSTNWEKNDSTGYSSIGTGMSESSGVFTFPQTGIYQIKLFATSYGSNGSSTIITARIQGEKANNGFADKAQVSNGVFTTNAYGSMAIDFYFDVTDTSGDHIRMTALAGNNDRKILGSSTVQRTGLTFIRLGDT